MKLKYFLRGLGMGIVFCSVILFTAYITTPKDTLSDEEIIEKAKELGMVEGESIKDKINASIENTSTENNTENLSVSTSEENAEDASSEESTTAASETSTEEATQEEEKSTQEDIKNENTSNEITSSSTYSLNIESGMTSWDVAILLNDAGFVNGVMDFDNYLTNNGYASKIRTGIFEIYNTDTYDEIAQKITGR